MNIKNRLQTYIFESQTVPLTNAPFYVKILAFIYRLLGRKQTAQLLVSSEQCTSCGHCAEICPNHAIKFRFDNPLRTKNCKGCLFCVYQCPNRAVELPLEWLVIALLLIFLPYDDYINNLLSLNLNLSMDSLSGIGLSLLLWSLGYAIVLFILKKLFFYIGILPLFKKIGSIPAIKKMRMKIHPATIFPILVPLAWMEKNKNMFRQK